MSIDCKKKNNKNAKKVMYVKSILYKKVHFLVYHLNKTKAFYGLLVLFCKILKFFEKVFGKLVSFVKLLAEFCELQTLFDKISKK